MSLDRILHNLFSPPKPRDLNGGKKDEEDEGEGIDTPEVKRLHRELELIRASTDKLLGKLDEDSCRDNPERCPKDWDDLMFEPGERSQRDRRSS